MDEAQLEDTAFFVMPHLDAVSPVFSEPGLALPHGFVSSSEMSPGLRAGLQYSGALLPREVRILDWSGGVDCGSYYFEVTIETVEIAESLSKDGIYRANVEDGDVMMYDLLDNLLLGQGSVHVGVTWDVDPTTMAKSLNTFQASTRLSAWTVSYTHLTLPTICSV